MVGIPEVDLVIEAMAKRLFGTNLARMAKWGRAFASLKRPAARPGIFDLCGIEVVLITPEWSCGPLDWDHAKANL